MKKLLWILILLAVLLPAGVVEAQVRTMQLYLVPVETNGSARGPKYFAWRFDPDPPGIDVSRSNMDYGFAPWFLVLARDISPEDHAFLETRPDVYVWPAMENLSTSIAPGDELDTFFEGVGIPTNWLTPSTTYLEFLRQMAAMFQFAQRYGGITSGGSLIEDTGGLDTKYSNWSQGTQDAFNATVASFGYDPSFVRPNQDLRQMLKQVGDMWGDTPFLLGGWEF